jgi:hypothetical protein
VTGSTGEAQDASPADSAADALRSTPTTADNASIDAGTVAPAVVSLVDQQTVSIAPLVLASTNFATTIDCTKPSVNSCAQTDRAGSGNAAASRSGSIAKLRNEREKLLGLYLDEKITSDFFGEKERRITAKIEGLEADQAEAVESAERTNALADAFEEAAAMLRDPGFDFDSIWDHVNDKERRSLIEDMIQAVTIYADRLEVTVTKAPPLLFTLDEVGLRSPGTESLVSEV